MNLPHNNWNYDDEMKEIFIQKKENIISIAIIFISIVCNEATKS